MTNITVCLVVLDKHPMKACEQTLNFFGTGRLAENMFRSRSIGEMPLRLHDTDEISESAQNEPIITRAPPIKNQRFAGTFSHSTHPVFVGRWWCVESSPPCMLHREKITRCSWTRIKNPSVLRLAEKSSKTQPNKAPPPKLRQAPTAKFHRKTIAKPTLQSSTAPTAKLHRKAIVKHPLQSSYCHQAPLQSSSAEITQLQSSQINVWTT